MALGGGQASPPTKLPPPPPPPPGPRQGLGGLTDLEDIKGLQGLGVTKPPQGTPPGPPPCGGSELTLKTSRTLRNTAPCRPAISSSRDEAPRPPRPPDRAGSGSIPVGRSDGGKSDKLLPLLLLPFVNAGPLALAMCRLPLGLLKMSRGKADQWLREGLCMACDTVTNVRLLDPTGGSHEQRSR